MQEPQCWKPELYDQKLGFVSEYGKSVIQLLHPQSGEHILDIGCGTGDLAYEIAASGAIVTGIDYSAPMIVQAKQKYPELNFAVCNGEQLEVSKAYDAVFSNAALHWMKRPELVVEGIWNALKSGGRFVAEFGGVGNCEVIIQAIYEVLEQEYGLNGAELNPWYFPSIGQYSSLLEKQGFHITYAQHFNRDSQFEDGELGLSYWLAAFADSFFHTIPSAELLKLYDKIGAIARPMLFRDGHWYGDYKRIRVVAIKP